MERQYYCFALVEGSGKLQNIRRNRVIRRNVVWKYVPTKQNTADKGGQGSPINKLGDLWYKDPTWFSNISLWPVNQP